jgi:preprotein translocase subunit SecB
MYMKHGSAENHHLQQDIVEISTESTNIDTYSCAGEPMSDTYPDAIAPHIALRSQYIKDLSFENPQAPASLIGMKDTPKVDMSMDLGAQRLTEDLFELTMQFNIRAVAERTVFLVDMVYAGVFSLANIPDDKLEPVLLIECAHQLYPFARRIIADVTRDGGFPPLLLEPIDFARMYVDKRRGAAA